MTLFDTNMEGAGPLTEDEFFDAMRRMWGDRGQKTARDDALRFTVVGHAMTAGNKTAFKHPHTGRIVMVEGRRAAAREQSRTWRQEVAAIGRWAMGAEDGVELPRFPTEPLYVQFEFVRPRPRGHYGARGLLKASAPAYPTTRPDVLKLARAAEDALTGIVWRDDSQIVHEALLKTFGEPERLEVLVRPMSC